MKNPCRDVSEVALEITVADTVQEMGAEEGMLKIGQGTLKDARKSSWDV